MIILTNICPDIQFFQLIRSLLFVNDAIWLIAMEKQPKIILIFFAIGETYLMHCINAFK